MSSTSFACSRLTGTDRSRMVFLLQTGWYFDIIANFEWVCKMFHVGNIPVAIRFVGRNPIND